MAEVTDVYEYFSSQAYWIINDIIVLTISSVL